MHTPSTLAARPLPKRTRSTAGLEELDTWLGQITSSSTNTTTSTIPSAPVSRESLPPPHVLSRKRHHSLPATAIAGSLQSLASSLTVETKSTSKASPSGSGRRPELAMFGGTSSNSLISNQFSPSLHHDHDVHTLDTTFSFMPPSTNHPTDPLQLPEMSPREDFLVRAFVSDAMKLEQDDDGGPRTTTYPSHRPVYPPPLELCTTVDENSGDVLSSAPTPRTPSAPTPTASHHKWTREEDDKLRDAVTRFGGKSWKLIAEMLGNGRTDVQCLHRWNKVLKPGLVKGPWTPEEDRILLNLIARYGVGQIRWCDVALHLPGRIGKQCRERWCNHLDSSIRKGQWTPQEDDIVFRLQQSIGNKWSEIAKHLPGRTENAVKNRFNSAARRKWLLSQQATAGTPGLVSSVPTTTRGKAPRGQSTRTPRGLLSADLLVGPPRPPPMPPTTTATSTYRFGPSPPTFGSSLESSTPFVFDNDLPHAPVNHAYLLPADTSDLRPAFSFHLSNAFPSGPSLFRTPFPRVAAATSLTSLLSPPMPHDQKEQESEAHTLMDEPLDKLALGDDNQVTHSPSGRRSSTTSPSDSHDKRRLSTDPHGDSALRAMDLPDSDTEDRTHDGGNSPVDMDDQNMSTFLDSVALELDDMI